MDVVVVGESVRSVGCGLWVLKLVVKRIDQRERIS